MFQTNYAYLGGHKALTTVFSRYRMYIDTRDVSIAPHLALEGTWEGSITRLVGRVLKPGMTFLDVGANFGYYSVLAGSLIGSFGRIFCFEADPRIHKMLFHTMELNGFRSFAQVENLAVYSGEGEVELSCLEHHFGSNTLQVFTEESARAELETVTKVKVSSVSLDHYFAGTDLRIDLAKIDVEGAEAEVLEGMKTIAHRINSIIIEFSPGRIKVAGFDPSVVLETLKNQYGFTIARIESDGNVTDIDQSAIIDCPTAIDLFLYRT